MAGGTRIIAFDSAGSDDAKDEILLTEEAPEIAASDWNAAEEPEAAPQVRRGWLIPVLAGTAVAGWTAFYGWALAGSIAAGPAPGRWVELIRDWAMPVLLVGIGVLIATRNSRREGIRFGEVARSLSDESARLEQKLSVVNRELSLAREFLAAQSRDLETLGRLAADKLSTEADRLQGLIHDNHARVEAIGSVSEAALDNMEKLRGQLPVIASSAKDVTNNIGNAGRTAHAQLQELIGGFVKLNEFGEASERQVQVLRGLVDETIAEFTQQAEQFGSLTAARFVEFRDRSAEFRTQLDGHEIEALAAVRNRASAMAEELEVTRRQLDGNEAESLTSMRARLSALREEGNAIARALRDGESRALEGWQASLAQMREDVQSALIALQEAESEAADSSRTRIAAIAEDLAGLERQALQHAARFSAEIERRHAEAAQAEQTAAAQMSEHLAALDAATTAQRARHAEVDRAVTANLADRLAHFDREIAERRAQQGRLEAEAAELLHSRFAAIDNEMAQRRTRHEAQSAAIVTQAETIAAHLAAFESRVAEITAHGGAAEAALGTSLRILGDRLAESRSALTGTEGTISALTDSSVRLLELIQASVKHSREELPLALARGEVQLSNIETRMEALRETAADTDARGVNLANTIDAASDVLRQTYSELGTLQFELEQAGSTHARTLAGLRQELEAIAGQSTELADDTRSRLTSALEDLSRSTREAIAGFGENGAVTVSALARQLGNESSAAIEQAMRGTAAETTGQLEQAVTRATMVGREAATQLRDQLAKVNELAGNLENRVAHARQRAEEQVDNDFTRRVALITESLNSNAIDIAKALSTDVADTAWTAYLRGDRGIFTRRAVPLVESADNKTIVQLYERDRDFHEHVSRYIHDFEAMLRQVLSARDGQALGVTLLSSDMGKLYVALAQAIERLRN